MNEKFKAALGRQPQECPPIWMMRQAGRYHKHYQALKEKHTFMELCLQPDLAAEVTWGPIEDFDFDIAILFSDLLFPLDALGLGLTYNPGPHLETKLTDEVLKRLVKRDEALPKLEFQKQAMMAARKKLPNDKSLIGFVGGPWTLFGYAVEGSHAGGLVQAKKDLNLFLGFCDILVPLLIENIRLQFEGGAEVVMILDTAAGELDSRLFKKYVAPQLRQLVRAYPHKLGYYTKGTVFDHLDDPTFTGEPWAGFGFDHRWDLVKILREARFPGFVQGNFDQGLLFQPHDRFQTTLREYLEPFKTLKARERAGWVAGVGHGVLPATPEENVRHFVKAVRQTFS